MCWVLKRTISLSESNDDRNQVHTKREKLVEIVRETNKNFKSCSDQDWGRGEPHSNNEKFQGTVFFIQRAKLSK